MRIEVERIEEDKLRRQVWWFKVDAGYGASGYGASAVTIRLVEWKAQERATKRHKWVDLDTSVAGEMYRFRNHNRPYPFRGWRRPAAEVPFPDDVVAEVKDRLMAGLVIVGPEDPKES